MDGYQAMTYDAVHKELRKILKRAGIQRRIYPHLFRHTRASMLASRVAEAPLEAQMGWVPGTKVHIPTDNLNTHIA